MTVLKRIEKITAKIRHIEERIKSGDFTSNKQRRRFKYQVCMKQATLRRLCQLYAWRVK